MDQIFAAAGYAEDQSNSHTILITHVLYRGFQTGAVFGPPIGIIQSLRRQKNNPGRVPASLLPTLVRSTGTASVVGTALIAVGLVVRMKGREEIEWKDRAYRLLYNKGQNEVDKWSLGGMVGGAGALGIVNQGFRGVGWRVAVGSTSLGGVGGILGYIAWRHGIKGGKWDED